MGTKNTPGTYDCYANAEPDEPMFILLGRDPDAAELVELWAKKRANRIRWNQKPPEDAPMVVEALNCASDMRGYFAQRAARPKKLDV